MSDDIAATRAAGYETEGAALARRKRSLAERIKVRAAYRRLFTKDGQLTGDAQLVLADLARTARLGKHNPLASNDELRERAAQRAIVLHILARLDPRALAELSDTLNGRK